MIEEEIQDEDDEILDEETEMIEEEIQDQDDEILDEETEMIEEEIQDEEDEDEEEDSQDIEEIDISEKYDQKDIIKEEIHYIDTEEDDEDEEPVEILEEIIELDDDESLEIVHIEENEIYDDDEEEEVDDEEEETQKKNGDNDYEIEVVEEFVEVHEAGLPLGNLGSDLPGEYRPDSLRKDRIVLDEKLDGYLGAMERFYNQYIWIENGEYTIGSIDNTPNTLPLQKVYLDDYYISKFPIINLLFGIFIHKTGYVTTAEKLGYGMVYSGRFQRKVDPNTGLNRIIIHSSINCAKIKDATWFRPFGTSSDLYRKRNHPVVQVSYDDATEFAKWLGKRLPTEEEWEVAARTNQSYLYPWGNEWIKNRCNVEESAMADTTAVDHYKDWENAFGIADILGNTMEWTATKSKKYDQLRIVKGASWISDRDVSLLKRAVYEDRYSSNIVSFRCVMDCQ